MGVMGGPTVGPIATPTVGPMVMGGPMVGPIVEAAGVSNCCEPHVNLGLSGVTSQQAHSYLMNLYKKNACDTGYLEELYNKCNKHHKRANEEPSYLNELYVEDCHAEHISDNCTPQASVPVTEAAGMCTAAQSVCTATGETNPACIAAKAQCGAGEAVAQPVSEAAGMCTAAQSVCTATGATNPACIAAKAQCGAGEVAGKKVIAVKDSKKRCPEAVAVCAASGANSP